MSEIKSLFPVTIGEEIKEKDLLTWCTLRLWRQYWKLGLEWAKEEAEGKADIEKRLANKVQYKQMFFVSGGVESTELLTLYQRARRLPIETDKKLIEAAVAMVTENTRGKGIPLLQAADPHFGGGIAAMMREKRGVNQ